jgi:phosphoribosylglycinamide formyltransferase 1
MQKSRIAIFASGSGTNAEAIINYFLQHQSISVAAVFCNNPKAFVIERARRQDIPVFIFDRQELYDTKTILDLLTENQITHIVLAGFLWIMPAYLIRSFPGRIINIHPALLPKYGGKGMYGMRIHELVKKSGDRETGITIHEVNEAYDEGRVIFKSRCKVDSNDSPEEIADKVHSLEHVYYPQVIEKWINNP